MSCAAALSWERQVRADSVLRSMQISGLKPSLETLAIMDRYVSGELTLESMAHEIDLHVDELSKGLPGT